MKIILDAMGGDNAPAAVVEGGIKAAADLGVTPVFVGDKDAIARHIGDSKAEYEIVHTTEAISGTCDATAAVKMKDSSMMKGMYMLRDGLGDAFISAGNTGALTAGATLIVKRIKGIRRVALSTVLPCKKRPCLLLDVGSNADCTPDFLLQFAIMGSCYMNGMYTDKATVGLLNIGTEPTKGNQLAQAAYELLSQSDAIDFRGNIEGRDIIEGDVDVLVADGFTGNITLKAIEGMGLYFNGALKGMLLKNAITKLAALAIKGGLTSFKKSFDYSEYGGAPILGASKVVFKAHGSSNARAFYNAIKAAKTFHDKNVISKIANNITR